MVKIKPITVSFWQMRLPLRLMGIFYRILQAEIKECGFLPIFSFLILMFQIS